MKAIELVIFTITLIIALPGCIANPTLSNPDPVFPTPKVSSDASNSDGSIPESLIGTWEGGDSYTISTRTFHKNGTFDYTGVLSTTLGGCSTNSFVLKEGIATVSGQNITLQEVDGTVKIEHSCNASNNFNGKAKLKTETLAWSIEATPSGELLHLGNLDFHRK